MLALSAAYCLAQALWRALILPVLICRRVLQMVLLPMVAPMLMAHR